MRDSGGAYPVWELAIQRPYVQKVAASMNYIVLDATLLKKMINPRFWARSMHDGMMDGVLCTCCGFLCDSNGSLIMHLKTLKLNHTQIKDLSPLSDLKQLEHLEFANNPVGDLTPVSNMDRLKHFDMSNTPVEDLKPLQYLTGLETLNCSGTSIKNLKIISNLVNLKRLSIYNTRIILINLKEKLCILQKCVSLPIRQIEKPVILSRCCRFGG